MKIRRPRSLNGLILVGFGLVVLPLLLVPGEGALIYRGLAGVIVGGMGSIPGAAVGALLIGLAEQLGSVYVPTYSVVVTFLIMVSYFRSSSGC